MKSSFVFVLFVTQAHADVQYPLSPPPAGGRSNSLNKYKYGPNYKPDLIYLTSSSSIENVFEYEFDEYESFSFDFDDGGRRGLRGLRGSK